MVGGIKRVHGNGVWCIGFKVGGDVNHIIEQEVGWIEVQEN